MKLNITLDESDYIKFNEYHCMNSKQGKKNIRSLRILLPAILALIISILIAVHADLTVIIIAAVTSVIISVLWIIFVPKILKNSVKNSVKQLKMDGKLPYTEEAELEFTDTEIIEAAKYSTMRVKYQDIENIGYTDEYIFIYSDSIHAFIVPRRCIGSDFESFLKSKIKN